MDDVTITTIYIFDSFVMRVGLYLSAMFVSAKVGLRLLSWLKSFLWPF